MENADCKMPNEVRKKMPTSDKLGWTRMPSDSFGLARTVVCPVGGCRWGPGGVLPVTPVTTRVNIGFFDLEYP
jgi:hypothetical protein